MDNQEENRIARDAAREAGIRGRDWNNNRAIDLFMNEFHTLPRYERQSMGYSGIYQYARDWWSMNSGKFS